jgi:hypothetical protein
MAAVLKGRMEATCERLATTFAFLVPARAVASTVIGTLARWSAPAKVGFPAKGRNNGSPTFCRMCFKTDIDDAVGHIATLSDYFSDYAPRRKCAEIPIDSPGNKSGDYGYEPKDGSN